MFCPTAIHPGPRWIQLCIALKRREEPKKEELCSLGQHFFSDTMTPGVTFTVVLKYALSKIIWSLEVPF